MASSKNKSRNRGKRPTATIDLKAKDVSEKVDVSKVLAKTNAETTAKSEPVKPASSDAAKGTPESKTSTSKPDTVPSSTDKPSPSVKDAGKAAHAGKDGASASAEPEQSTKQTPRETKASPQSTSSTAIKTSTKSPGLGGAATHLLAGGLGGVLALFGAGQFADSIPGLGTTSGGGQAPVAISDAVEKRLAALESRESAPTGKIELPAELDARLKGLEALNTKMSSLADTQGKLTSETAALSGQIKALADPAGGGATELRQRLDSMEGTIASLAKAADGATDKSIPKLAALAGRLNDIRTELDAKITAAKTTLTGDIEKRLATVNEALKASGSDKTAADEALETLKGGTQRLSVGLETARNESTRIANDVTSLRALADTTTSTVESLKKSAAEIADRIAKLESTTTQNISALPSKNDILAAIAPVNEKLTAFEDQLGGVIKRETARAESAKNVLLSLELANLQRALDQGRSVKSQVASIKKSAPSGIDLSLLDKLAEDNIPSQEALVREFSSVASQAVEAESLDENASTFDKLFASARSIVKVRKTGDVEGNTTEAILARAEDKLKANDLQAAVTELETLKDRAGQAVTNWLVKARDRLSIDATFAQIEAGLKSSVSNSATN